MPQAKEFKAMENISAYKVQQIEIPGEQQCQPAIEISHTYDMNVA